MESTHHSSSPNTAINISESPASAVGARNNPRLITTRSSSQIPGPIPVSAQQINGTVSRQGGTQTDNHTSIPAIPQSNDAVNHAYQPHLNVDVLNHSLTFLPTPKSPSECQLLCVFYAEFDIVVGPKICFQCPEHFLDHDITISSREINECLSNTFHPSNNIQGQNIPLVATNSLSIFDSTSEYIIPGNELADRIISLSTHSFHILTRATILFHSRYQRNSLLFSVGFVIRRAMDPSPFRPLLSKLSSTLRAMEMERQFLSDSRTRSQIGTILRCILLSLNNHECNLILDDANSLNLKLFKTPSGFVSTVPDFVVPVLLRPEWQVLSFDWDLTINWIVPWVDGIKNVRLIAQASSVDVDMVRASIQVLQYHGVVALVDQFWYSNIYECTQLASQMLAGHQPKLLTAMYDFVCKIEKTNDFISSRLDPITAATASPGVHSLATQHRFSSVTSKRSLGTSWDLLFTTPSYNECVSVLSSHQETSDDDVKVFPSDDHEGEKSRIVKGALSLLYCSCSRDKTFGDVLLSQIVSLRKTNEYDDNKVSNTKTCDTEIFSGSLEESEGINNPIDWIQIFELFDHRRFVTFGVVFGLIHRVHAFPYAFDIIEHESVSDDTFTTRVKNCMDGTKSDDELSCLFQQTYTSLVSLVKYSRRTDVLVCHSIL